MTADVNQIVTEALGVGYKAFQGHAGRPGKRGGSAPKGGAEPGKSTKPKYDAAARGRDAEKLKKWASSAAHGAVATAGGMAGAEIGAALAGPIGGIIGGALGMRTGWIATTRYITIAKLAASKLKALRKTKATKASEITDDEVADKLIEALIAALENYKPEEAVKK
jgi:hypothetical protein